MTSKMAGHSAVILKWTLLPKSIWPRVVFDRRLWNVPQASFCPCAQWKCRWKLALKWKEKEISEYDTTAVQRFHVCSEIEVELSLTNNEPPHFGSGSTILSVDNDVFHAFQCAKRRRPTIDRSVAPPFSPISRVIQMKRLEWDGRR